MGISLWQALIVLVVVILLFGTSRLKNVGSDLGSALKGFKKAVKDDEQDNQVDSTKEDADFDSLTKPAAKTDESVKTTSSAPASQKPVEKE